MEQDLVSDLGVVGWALQIPSEQFFPFSNRLKDLHFQSQSMKLLWKRLISIYEHHERFPSLGEAAQVVASITELDPDGRNLLLPLLQKCYTVDVSGYTGETITNWVAERSLGELSITMNAWASGDKQRTLAEELTRIKTQIEELEQLGTDAELGTPFRPFCAATIANPAQAVELSYAGNTFATGYPGIDNRLRNRGFRGHGSIIFGPTGGGKTELVLNMALHGVRKGARVLWFSFDDDAGELQERVFSNTICESFRPLAESNPNWAQKRLEAAYQERVVGTFEGVRLQPSTYTPQDLSRAALKMQRRFRKEDLQAMLEYNVDDPGSIDLAVFDTTDQVKAHRHYQKEWYELEKLFEQMCGLTEILQCPVMLTSQGGQETMGASQATLRNISNAFGKNRAAKFIGANAQTYHQIHNKKQINFSHPKVQANLVHLAAMGVDPFRDRETRFEPFWFCILKNTLADDSIHENVRLVKLPFLFHHRTCRVVEDYEMEVEPIMEDRKTQREERQADGTDAPNTAGAKRGSK